MEIDLWGAGRAHLVAPPMYKKYKKAPFRADDRPPPPADKLQRLDARGINPCPALPEIAEKRVWHSSCAIRLCDM